MKQQLIVSIPPTAELYEQLKREINLQHFIDTWGEVFIQTTFADYITRLCQQNKESKIDVIRSAGLKEKLGYSLFSGERSPSRDSVIQLAFGFGMDSDQAQELLKLTKFGILSPKVHRDVLIIFALNQHHSVEETNRVLTEHKLPVLGEKWLDGQR